MNGQVVTSSRDISEKFGKRHDKLTSEIKRMYSDLIGSPQNGGHPLFIESSYIHEQNGQSYTEYLMNRDGFSLLVMGFTGKKALEWKLKYIEAFNKMEETLKSSNIISEEEKLKLKLFSKDPMEVAMAHNKLIELATAPLIAENEELKPKARFHDAVHTSVNSISVGKFSGVLQKNELFKRFGRNKLFQWLRDNDYLCVCGDLKNKPTQKALSGGYMDYDEYVTDNGYGKSITTYKPLITGKGQIYFTEKLLKDFQ
nr:MULTISPECIES: phage regulatory protein/antirepressor Ant [unclassified Lactonifactor]